MSVLSVEKTKMESNLSKTSNGILERRRNVENFILIWLVASDDQRRHVVSSIVPLRHLINTVETFIDPNQCLDFIRGIRNEQAFLVISDSLCENTISLFHALPQLNSIYMFSFDNRLESYEHLVSRYDKLKGCFTTIASICECIKRDTRRAENNITPMNIIDLKSLSPSFMYSKFFQEILVNTDWVIEKAKNKLAEFCRQEYAHNPEQLRLIDEFGQEYNKHTPASWYSRECFLYKILNKALRTLDLDALWVMGFYMRDLTRQVAERYSASSGTTDLLLYRGQEMLNDDFEKLRNSEGGLLSFTNFLSTTTDRTVALFFISEGQNTPVGCQAVLFEMNISVSNHFVPFTSLDGLSYYQSEQEYLFSTHTVFRIGNSVQMTNGIWQVRLNLTTEDADTDLRLLTERVRRDVIGTAGQLRLEKLMFKMGEWQKARGLYEGLLERTTPEDTEKLALFHHNLATIYKEQGDLDKSITYFRKSIELKLTYLSENDPELADMYSNMGVALKAQGKLDEAMKNYQRSLQLEIQAPQPNQENIAKNYAHIGAVLVTQGHFIEGQENFEKALHIQLSCLPPTHPQLAITYNYLFHVYHKREDHPTALAYAKSCLNINQKSLPPHSFRIANAHHNVALCLCILGKHNDALQHQEQAVKLAHHTLSLDHSQMKSFQAQLDLIRSMTSE